MLFTFIVLTVVFIVFTTIFGLILADRDDKALGLLAGFAFGLNVSFWGWVIYVAMHFILKFW